jgi:hypothetical protein
MTPTDVNTPALDPPATAVEDVPFEDVTRAHKRFHDERAAGRVDPDRQFVNQHIAYYDGRIIDHDPDPAALYQRIAALPRSQQELVVLYFLERSDAISG